MAAGMPVISMFSNKGIEVEVNISAADYANRDRLTSIYCQFDQLPGKEFPLKIKSISAEANASQLYTVRMNFTGQYDRSKITPGMSTIVYGIYENDSTYSTVNVPSNALLEKNGYVL